MSEYFSWDALKAYVILFFCLVLPLGAVVYYSGQTKTTNSSKGQEVTVPSESTQEPGLKPTYKVTPLVNREYFPSLIDRIDQADTSIKILMYLFIPPKKGDPTVGPKGIRDHLLQAAERGVTIDVVLSLKDAPSPELSITHISMLKQLQHSNIRGFIHDGASKLHTKMLLIDRKEAIVGAHNWTYSSINNSHEVSLWIRSDQPMTKFHQWFDRIRSSAKPYDKLRRNQG